MALAANAAVWRTIGRRSSRWFTRTGSSSWAAATEKSPAAVLHLPSTLGSNSIVDRSLLEEDWCALYINLARRPDRRKQLLRMLSCQNSSLLQRLERIDAVDGRDLSLSDHIVQGVVQEGALARARRAQESGLFTIIHSGRNLVHFDDHLTQGGVACAMSHRLALERVADHPTAGWGLILEDDVSAAVPGVERFIANMLTELPEDWDAVFLGYHEGGARLHTAAYSSPEAELRVPIEDNGPEIPVIHMTSGLYGLYAWMVRKEAARQLVEHAFPIDGQVDFALSNWLARERGCTFKVEPTSFLFYSPKSEEGEDSDVQTMISIDEVTQTYESLQDYVFDAYMALNTESFWEDPAVGSWRDLDFEEGTWHGMPPPPCEPPASDCSPEDIG